MTTQHLSPDREERARVDLIEDWSPDTVQAVRDSILATLDSAGWLNIETLIAREIESIQAELVERSKPLDSPAEYEQRLGRIRGLRSIESLIDGVILAAAELERNESGSI